MTGEDVPEEEIEALESVSHGAIVSAGGVTAQKALLFGTNFVLTAGLSVSLYGVYAFGWRIVRFLFRLAPLGAPPTLLRFLPKYRNDVDRQDRILGTASVTTLVGSLLLASVVFVAADGINRATLDNPALPPTLRLFAVLLPFGAALRLLGFLFRALEEVEVQMLLLRILRPAVQFVAAAVAISLGYSVSGVVGSMVIGFALLTVFAVWLARAVAPVRPATPTSFAEVVEFVDYAAPNSVKQLGSLFRNRVDVLLIGFFLTASAAGIYNIALFLTSVIAIPLIAFNQLLPPVASRLYTEGREDTLNDVYSTITRLVFTITLLIAIPQFVYRVELLAIFGAEYTRGSLVLAVFVVGRIVGNSVGATGWLLLMTDHQYLRMVNSLALAVLNVAVSYYFIVTIGLLGAALGTAGSIAVINLLRLGQLWYLEGLQPYDAKFLKPLGAGLVMAVVLSLLKPILSGVTLLVVGSAFGMFAFLVTLSILGIERRDKLVYRSLYRDYRTTVVDAVR